MKSSYRGTKEELMALNAYMKLMRCAESVTARVHRHLGTANLTVSQFGVMEALYHLGPLPQTELGKKILRTSGNMTMVIDNLEQRGLVLRERYAADRRYFRVHLTEKGGKLISGFFPSHAERITAELSILTSAEQAELARLCKKLGLGKQDKKEVQ